MRLLVVVLVTGFVAVGLAELLNYGVTYWAPCQGEGLACTMDGIVGSVVTLVVAALTTITFGIIVFWRATPVALSVTGACLLIPAAILLYFTLDEIYVLRDGWSFYWREYQKLLQIVAPPALVVAVQWLLLRLYLFRIARPA